MWHPNNRARHISVWAAESNGRALTQTVGMPAPLEGKRNHRADELELSLSHLL